MHLKLPNIVTGRVIPPAVQEKILKEEKDKRFHKKQRRQQFFHDLLIAVISVLLGNVDRIFTFVSNLIKNLLNG